MKTRKIFAAALALPMLFACTKVEIVPTEQPAEGDKGFDISVVVNSDNETKAVFDDAEGILWVNPGSAGLVTSEFDNVPAQKSTAATPSEDGRQSTFKFEGITAGTYRLFYPYCETYYPNIKFTVPANQTQDAGGKSSDIFAGMATEDITATEGENSVDVKYRAVGSYIQFLVYGKAGEKVRFISVVSSDSKIAGDYSVNATDFKHTVLEGGSERVLVALGDAGYTTKATADEATGIYAAVLPGSSKNTYYVTTDKATYIFESSEAKPFEAGKIKTVKLNLDNAKVKDLDNTVPENLYLIGDATEAGWDCWKPVTLTKTGNVFSVETYLDSSASLEGFKFITTIGSFDYSVVNAGDNSSFSYKLLPQGENDRKFKAPHFGLYLVEVNFDTKCVTLTERAPYLVSDFTHYHFTEGEERKPLQLEATSEAGVFKAERVFIWHRSYEENGETKYCTNEFKFAFKKTDGSDIDYSFSIQPNNDKNYEIAMGKEYYLNGNSKKDIIMQSLNARVVGKSGAIDHSNSYVDYKWMVKGSYNHKYYDITLDLNKMTMSIKLTQGQDFYLVGINGKWSSEAPKTTAEDGVAKWTEYVDVNTNGWDGTFKICGVNTTDNFWDGEWYNAQLDNNGAWWWNGDTYGQETPVLFENIGGHDRKWKMTESGTYDFVFDTKNLTLKVTKK